jgi:hypothetical protein
VAKLKDVTEPTEQTKEKEYRQPDRKCIREAKRQIYVQSREKAENQRKWEPSLPTMTLLDNY